MFTCRCVVVGKRPPNNNFLRLKSDNKFLSCSVYFTTVSTSSNVNTFNSYVNVPSISRSIHFRKKFNYKLLNKQLQLPFLISESLQCTAYNIYGPSHKYLSTTHISTNKITFYCGINSLFIKNQNVVYKVLDTKKFSSSSMQTFVEDYSTILKSISESTAVEFTKNYLVWLHTYTGLPWWAIIVLATITVRSIITLPLMIYQHYILAKVQNLKYEMNNIIKELKMEANLAMTAFKWSESYTRNVYNRSIKKQWNKLIVRENCHPMKAIVVVMPQIPIWIVLSFSLRSLCYMVLVYGTGAPEPYLDLITGGFGWITDLIQVDPYYIIPVSLGLTNLLITEIHYLMRLQEPTKVQKYAINFLRLVSVGFVPIAATVPSCISLYWLTSSTCGLFQNLLLMSPKFRRLSGIPKTDTELSHPYSYLCERIKNKFNLKSKLIPPA